jgi:hypothetical protein
VNAAVHPGVVECGVRDAPMVAHSKRPASDGMLDIAECKRLKQEDQSKKSDLLHSSAAEPIFTQSSRMQRHLVNSLYYAYFSYL